jgi:transcriptional regulator with GAF, ATPase, and Fis domain
MSASVRRTGEQATAQVTTLDGAGGRDEARASPAASLTAVHPRGLRWQMELDERAVVVGREAHGAARLEHGTVSRQHLELRWDATAGHHTARELGSRNGARVEGVLLRDRAAALGEGSLVQLGDVFAVYQRGARAGDAAGDVLRDALPGRAPTMDALRALVARAAADPSPVLISGETGTGKEWIARALHAHSGRRGPLVAVNCAALGRELLESQLFGHIRGAFTGAAADQRGLFRTAEGGTLFLDELGELPLELQPKLLRALQEREVLAVGATRPVKIDVRVCAATNRDLAAAVEREGFRRDLHARLALWELIAPPLRARRVDLLDWLDRAHQRWCAERGRAAAPLELTPAAVEAILLHAWPDNLRGLERLVHALAGSGSGSGSGAGAAISRAELPPWLLPAPEPALPAAATAAAEPRRRSTTAAPASEPARPPVPTAEALRAAHAELGGNVRALARKYGRDRRQIYRWLEAHGLARGAAELDGPNDDDDD